MKAHRIIAIGASAGGVEALQAILGSLPGDLPAALLVVIHIAEQSLGLMPRIINRGGALEATQPEDGEPIELGRVYVASPDHHLLVEPPGYMRLTRGPKENRFRPAVDPLFRSAAYVYGPRVVGVILSGALDDGAAGLWAVKDRGGVAVVQDPSDAFISSMPESALRQVEVDHCLRAAEIGPLLIRLAAEPVTMPHHATEPMDMESEVLMGRGIPANEIRKIGRPSFFVCPECHGGMQEITEGTILRYRCHTGHAYSTDSLLLELTLTASETLWSAQRAAEETAMLLLQEAERAGARGNHELCEQYLEERREAQETADGLRTMVMKQKRLSRAKVEKGR